MRTGTPGSLWVFRTVCLAVFDTCKRSGTREIEKDREFEAILGYIVSSRPAFGYTGRPCVKNKEYIPLAMKILVTDTPYSISSDE